MATNTDQFNSESSNLPDHLPTKSKDQSSTVFPPLDLISRPTVETVAAAFYLNRKPQTLRVWACFENGPIKPLRVNGRLAWKVQDIKELMGAGK